MGGLTSGSSGIDMVDLVEGSPDERRCACADSAARDRLGGPWMGSVGLSRFLYLFIFVFHD